MLFYGLVGPYGRKPNRSKLLENTRKGDWKINDKIDEKNSKKIRKKKKKKKKKAAIRWLQKIWQDSPKIALDSD